VLLTLDVCSRSLSIDGAATLTSCRQLASCHLLVYRSGGRKGVCPSSLWTLRGRSLLRKGASYPAVQDMGIARIALEGASSQRTKVSSSTPSLPYQPSTLRRFFALGSPFDHQECVVCSWLVKFAPQFVPRGVVSRGFRSPPCTVAV